MTVPTTKLIHRLRYGIQPEFDEAPRHITDADTDLAVALEGVVDGAHGKGGHGERASLQAEHIEGRADKQRQRNERQDDGALARGHHLPGKRPDDHTEQKRRDQPGGNRSDLGPSRHADAEARRISAHERDEKSAARHVSERIGIAGQTRQDRGDHLGAFVMPCHASLSSFPQHARCSV
jgi:hypothetical protein